MMNKNFNGFMKLDGRHKKQNILFLMVLFLGIPACATSNYAQLEAPIEQQVVVDKEAMTPAGVETPSIDKTQSPGQQSSGQQSSGQQSSGQESAQTVNITSVPVVGSTDVQSASSNTVMDSAPSDIAVEPKKTIPAVQLPQAPGRDESNMPITKSVTKSIPTDIETVKLDTITAETLAIADVKRDNDYVDIRSQYTDYDGPVPVIRDPKSCGKNKYEIRVVVQNINKEKGVINADLHDDVQENFLVGAKAVLRIWATAHKDQISFCIPVSKPGEYAVAIYHDKNVNHKFDKNFLGIPKERFGMSNNPRFGTKSPKYNQAVFTVPEEGADITIKLRKASDILGRQN